MRFKPGVSPEENSRLISDPNASLQSRWDYAAAKKADKDAVRYTPLQMAIEDGESPQVYDRLATL